MNKKSLMSESMLENLLASLLHFMASSGMSRKQIEAAFSVCMQELSRPKGSKKWEQMAAPRVGDETVESAVLRLWHRTSRYLDSDAQPVPLKLYGRSPSVEALVRMQGASVNPRLVIRGLQSVGLIFRTSRGLYLPAQDSATIRQLHRLSVEHVGKSVMRLLGTVLRNTDPSQARTPLIERSARVPDLDAREAKAFAEFTQKQGLAYLQAVDDWLETRRVARATGKRRSRKGSMGAGVHLFAYIGDELDGRVSSGPAAPDAESSLRSTSAVRSGNRRVAAPCNASGARA